MKLIVCESCEAEFQIKHTLHEDFYRVSFCVFCGSSLADELEDDMEWNDEEYI